MVEALWAKSFFEVGVDYFEPKTSGGMGRRPPTNLLA